jgi:SAM-dependent methyltransferase
VLSVRLSLPQPAAYHTYSVIMVELLMVRWSSSLLFLMIIAAALTVKGTAGFCSSAVSTHRSTTPRLHVNYANKKGMSEREEEKGDIIPSFQRRSLLLSTFTGAYCSFCFPPLSADAVIEVTQPSTTYLPRRNKFIDYVFAQQMATGMTDYEKEVEPYKTELFQRLFYSFGGESANGTYVPVIVEVGMGTFPNAKYYAQALSSSSMGLKGFDIVGVDPNNSMSSYAQDNARRFGLSSSLRTVNGVAEALPFADGSVDAIVTTLTLCSVVDQTKALLEIRRVLKPNSGKFLFWEHVLSEDDSTLALQQALLNPLQTFSADGCHLNRRTGMNINKVFDGKVDLNYMILEDKWVIGPTAFGIATA